MESTHPLRAYRAAHGVSSADLAKTLGIAEPTLRSFENGHRKISAEMAVDIEEKLGIDRSLIRGDLWSNGSGSQPSEAAA